MVEINLMLRFEEGRTQGKMPSKAQLNRRRKLAAARCVPKNAKLKYFSKYGLHDEILSTGVSTLSSDNPLGVGFNAHYWIVNSNGKIIDPTPSCVGSPPLRCKNGSVKPYYEEFTEEIQEMCNINREEFMVECCEEEGISVEEFIDGFADPEPQRCYQNCKYYMTKHPECKMVCGAFGYILDVYPHPCPPAVKKLKKYIALDYGY
jgi:hypothetical protein